MSEIDDLLDGAIRDFKEARHKLTTAQRKLGDCIDDNETANIDPALLLHSRIGCVIVDSLEPAIRDLGNLSTTGIFPATIRPAAPGDFEGIYKIITATKELERSDRDALIPEDIEASLREPKGIFLIAEDNGTIAGLIYAIQETSTTAIIRYLAVVPELRRHGIATRLLSACMHALAREWNVKEIGAFVERETPIAALLRTHTFRPGKQFVWVSRDIAQLAKAKASGAE